MDDRFIEDAMKNYGDTVLRAAASVTGNQPDAEDVFSDVFFALFRYHAGFVSEEHLKAWLIRVALNQAKNLRSSYWSQNRLPLSESIPAPEQDLTSAYDVPAALQALEPDSRAAVYLHYYEGYAYRDIAGMLLLSEGGVRTKVARARAELKAYLSD